ncbi:hypothetical protein L2D08_14490 [Domibacillus sp. PGB-M46]|uniref:hypothetical protein n=1 Tax=Domibacillus sp. PGB-M46 TaxID=2910255 RepID=UPI001F59AA82|nr:hypothetical protein [Domibacillus sp. PGB-M46]MCI2255578.1 hypothetical protein [Domibacillus sp. PGB-M46]
MGAPKWHEKNSNVLHWHIPGEETPIPAVKKKTSFIHPAVVTGIVSLAIGVGTFFSVIMINAVDIEKEQKQQAVNGNERSVQETKPTDVKDVTVALIQGGIFSTAEAAEKAKPKNVPTAVIPSEGQFLLLLGAASTMEEAKELAEPIEQKGMEVYVKELSIPMTNDIKKQLLSEKDQQNILDLLKTVLS